MLGISSNSTALRPLLTTVITALICTIPLGFLYHSFSKDSLEHIARDHPMAPFVWEIHVQESQPQEPFFSHPAAPSTPTLRYLTHESLLLHVHLLIHIPSPCTTCDLEMHAISALVEALEKHFKQRQHFEESDIQLIYIVAISPSSPYLSTIRQWPIAAGPVPRLILVQDSSQFREDLRTIPTPLSSSSSTTSSPSLSSPPSSPASPHSTITAYIFDRNGHLRGAVQNLHRVPTKIMRRLISQVFFQASMNEYLHERTFFGRKKTALPPH